MEPFIVHDEDSVEEVRVLRTAFYKGALVGLGFVDIYSVIPHVSSLDTELGLNALHGAAQGRGPGQSRPGYLGRWGRGAPG